MRDVNVSEITKNIKEMCIEANHFLSEDMKKVFDQAMDAFGEVINQMAKWLQKRLDELNEYKSKIKK